MSGQLHAPAALCLQEVSSTQWTEGSLGSSGGLTLLRIYKSLHLPNINPRFSGRPIHCAVSRYTCSTSTTRLLRQVVTRRHQCVPIISLSPAQSLPRLVRISVTSHFQSLTHQFLEIQVLLGASPLPSSELSSRGQFSILPTVCFTLSNTTQAKYI